MHARVSTIYGTEEQGTAAVQQFREEILGPLAELDGYKGAFLLVDRDSGKAVAGTLWESEQAMTASEEQATRLRRQAAETAGATEMPTVDRYEVVVWEPR